GEWYEHIRQVANQQQQDDDTGGGQYQPYDAIERIRLFLVLHVRLGESAAVLDSFGRTVTMAAFRQVNPWIADGRNGHDRPQPASGSFTGRWAKAWQIAMRASRRSCPRGQEPSLQLGQGVVQMGGVVRIAVDEVERLVEGPDRLVIATVGEERQ